MFVLPKTGKSEQKTINFFIFQNLGNDITLNIGLLNNHRYLIRLFIKP